MNTTSDESADTAKSARDIKSLSNPSLSLEKQAAQTNVWRRKFE